MLLICAGDSGLLRQSVSFTWVTFDQVIKLDLIPTSQSLPVAFSRGYKKVAT